jgi:flagellin
MALSLSTNVSAINAQNNLSKTTAALNTTFQRLSSGLRINSAKDDPAGLAMADSLQTDARLAAVAIRNANDGISLTSIADSAMSEIGNILSRMGELAQQSANGVYTNSQRSALSSEFTALGSEIERIATTTSFNDRALLSNSQSVSLQVGLDSSSDSQITITAINGTLAALGLAASGSTLSFSVIANSDEASQSAATAALTAVTGALSSLNSSRGSLGAAESRLSFAIDNLAVARENFIAAESRIRDADVAQEVAEMVRLQVLQQATTAVLAQANQQPQLVLQLLQ